MKDTVYEIKVYHPDLHPLDLGISLRGQILPLVARVRSPRGRIHHLAVITAQGQNSLVLQYSHR